MNPPLAPSRGPECPPRVQLEQASAGDWLPGVKTHVDTCASCTAQVKSLQTMTAEFLAARPQERFLKQLEARPVAQKRRVSVFAYAGAAAMALVISAAGYSQLRSDASGIGMKGSLSRITVKRGETMSTLSAGEKLAPGDALRFEVQAKTDGFAVVLERDATGKVTVVAPFDAKEPMAVSAGTTELPDSAVLDATRGPETFITIFSERPFDVSQVARTLSCDGCQVETSTWEKP
ncbi:MAG: DUF4384 domain-containing protein [Archangium sp.]